MRASFLGLEKTVEVTYYRAKEKEFLESVGSLRKELEIMKAQIEELKRERRAFDMKIENSGHARTEYWNPGEINEPENSKNNLNFLHLNISSLPFHFSDLQHCYHPPKLILI